MLTPFGPIRNFEPVERVARRYAFVFAPDANNLTAAIAFTGEPDRVLVGLDQPWDRGTTPATLLPLLRLISIDPWAHLLVLLPDEERGQNVFMGMAPHLARMIQERAPACWSALASTFANDEAIASVYPTLQYSDLGRDVLQPDRTRARVIRPAAWGRRA